MRLITILENGELPFGDYIRAVDAALPDGGEVDFEEYGDGLEMADLRADVRGGGWGSAAMKVITDLADEYGVPLMLIPTSSHGKATHTRLERFYRRFGFDGEEVFHRMPNG